MRTSATAHKVYIFLALRSKRVSGRLNRGWPNGLDIHRCSCLHCVRAKRRIVMSHEIEQIVLAIESLRQEANPFKDYLFPIITGAFSSLLGFIVAYFTLRYQENIQTQKERIKVVNDWMLLVEGAITSLIAIKANYHGKLGNDPFQRTLSIHSIIHSTKKLDADLSSLSFIIPRKEDEKSLETKWRQLPRIRAMIENYNFIIELWNKRSEIERPIKEKLVKEYGTLAFAVVDKEQIFKCINPAEFIVLMDLTERAVKYTDDLIVEMNDFMTEFPEIGKSFVSKKSLRNYGPVIIYSSEDNERLLNIIKKSPEVNYQILAELLGETEEQVRSEYTTGYE